MASFGLVLQPLAACIPTASRPTSSSSTVALSTARGTETASDAVGRITASDLEVGEQRLNHSSFATGGTVRESFMMRPRCIRTRPVMSRNGC
jgi:hypothetical protein